MGILGVSWIHIVGRMAVIVRRRLMLGGREGHHFALCSWGGWIGVGL